MSNSDHDESNADRVRCDAPQGELAPSARLLRASNRRHVDTAIDAALRSVSLPQGLITRLGMMVRNMPDESGGPVDWLGC